MCQKRKLFMRMPVMFLILSLILSAGIPAGWIRAGAEGGSAESVSGTSDEEKMEDMQEYIETFDPEIVILDSDPDMKDGIFGGGETMFLQMLAETIYMDYGPSVTVTKVEIEDPVGNRGDWSFYALAYAGKNNYRAFTCKYWSDLGYYDIHPDNIFHEYAESDPPGKTEKSGKKIQGFWERTIEEIEEGKDRAEWIHDSYIESFQPEILIGENAPEAEEKFLNGREEEFLNSLAEGIYLYMRSYLKVPAVEIEEMESDYGDLISYFVRLYPENHEDMTFAVFYSAEDDAYEAVPAY